MAVPRSGSAPDVKRGVLNSCVLINGQQSPLASNDSESPERPDALSTRAGLLIDAYSYLSW